MKRIAAIVVLASLATCAACADKVYRVKLTEAWPDRPGDFDEVAKKWTRHGRIMSGWDLVLRIHATFKSPEWRAAYVAERTKRQHLRNKDRIELLSAHKEHEKKFYEIELLLSTYERGENDIARGKKSMWRIWLIDGDGKQMRPLSIRKDKRPRGVIREYFPDFDDFDVAYIVRFPRTVKILRRGSKQFSLRMASAHGAVEVVWLEQK